MSSTLHFSLLRDPKLIDVVDQEWEQDVLPEDDAIMPDGLETMATEVENGPEDKSRPAEGWVDLGLQGIH